MAGDTAEFESTTSATAAAVQNGHYPPIKKREKMPMERLVEVPLLTAVVTYLGYAILILTGHIGDFLRKLGLKTSGHMEVHKKDDLFKMNLEFEHFYTRNIYRRASDGLNRPIASTPGAYFDLVDRTSYDFNWTFKFTGTKTTCLNLGSNNYLGFAENTGVCAEAAMQAIHVYGAGCCNGRRDFGTLDIHKDLEKQVARFVGKPAALIFGMGFATNSANIPALVGKGSLIVSDKHNHTSLILGARISGATIRVFKHNTYIDLTSLEKLLCRAITEGQPHTHRPWKKILIVIEGVYSMEGSAPNLLKAIELKKKYKAYLYLDEAHSIGAMGENGRGACEYWGVDPSDVDIMMGSFSKCFGGCGGYIAADYEIINHLRRNSHATTYGAAMSAPVAQQIITSMKIIMGEDGTKEGKRRLAQLIDNSRYFRKRLHEMGFVVYGNEESPVVPILVYQPGRAIMFSRLMLERKIAVVVVGFPATSLTECRVRICLSAAHTREMLDFALKKINEVGTCMFVKK